MCYLDNTFPHKKALGHFNSNFPYIPNYLVPRFKRKYRFLDNLISV